MRRIALNLRQLASRKATERHERQRDLNELTVLRTPVTPIYDLSDDARHDPPEPPPLPSRAAAKVPTVAPSTRTFTSMRPGVVAPSGLGRSSVLFLAGIALAVLAVSAIALATLVPTSEWAFLGS